MQIHGTTRLIVIVVLLCAAGLSPLHAQTSYDLTDTGFVPVAVPEPGSAEADMAQARRLIAQDQPGKAIKFLDAWIKARPGDPLLVEALLLRGDAKVAQGDYYKALYDYEELITFYPASPQYVTALEREYEIAIMFTTGVKRKLWGMKILPAGGEGAELLIRIQERAPGSAIGEKASIALADYYFQDGDMQQAADGYDLFLQNYPGSELRQWALLRLVQSSLARFKGPEFDATGLIDAAERLEQFRDEYPAAADRIGADGLLVRIRESLARRDYATASWYERTDRIIAADLLYRRLLEEYPDTSAARDAVKRLEKLDVPVAVTTASDAGSPVTPE